MNALMRLETYNSSDSDDNEKNLSETVVKRLPVPEFLGKSSERKETYKEENEDGKIRNFPHEPGIWATYVYIPLEAFSDFIEYLESLKDFIHPLKLNIVDDFHISLTRTVILKHHWIQGFTEIARKSLMNVECFRIFLSGLKVYVNEEKTRTFLSLIVKEGVENLINITNQLDQCLKEYNLQPFYKDPSFHLSLLWCSGNRSDEINAMIKKLPLDLKTFGFFRNVSHCFCTSGNKSFRFNFHPCSTS